jgi:hypothetical protein
MAKPLSSITALARALSRKGSEVRTPPNPVTRHRKATVVSVQAANNTCSITIGGSSTVVPRVKYLKEVTPSPGDLVCLVINGKDPYIIGTHV